MKPVICFEMLYPELNPDQKIARIADKGFNRVEFWGWRDKDIPAIKSACRESGVEVANFSGHRKGSPVADETHSIFLADLKDAAGSALDLHCPTLMLLTNELDEEGLVVDGYDRIGPEEKYRNVGVALERALEATPDGISLVLEPLNTRIDHPGYYLEGMSTAASLIDEIANPRLRILADLYHLGVMGEDLVGLVERHTHRIGYIHIADFPGRHEPGTGSADWYSLLSRVRETGYTGDVGFEYAPLQDSDQSLEAIRSLWDRVMA